MSQLKVEAELLKSQDTNSRLKDKRNEYLTTLKDVLDLYLFSVMEEEDTLYDVLHQHSEYECKGFNTLKILSPFNLQMYALISLPFPSNHIKLEYDEPGFVKIKLPGNVENEMTCSKIWRDACHRGVQKTLNRHLASWMDENNFLKQTEVLKWFTSVVDRSLNLTGSIPNYLIRRMPIRNKVILELEDLKSENKFMINLLPVIVFPVHQLPEVLSSTVLEDPTCDEWMAECRSNESCHEKLWGVSLWQHERIQISKNSSLKPLIGILKSLRDGCQRQEGSKWHLLTNYHLRTLVLLEFFKNPDKFEGVLHSELLLQLLLELRDRLVSREGLPFFWDTNHNLLCGMNGHQKSELARSVTQIRDKLRCSTFDPLLFRLQTYSPTLGSPDHCKENMQPPDQPQSPQVPLVGAASSQMSQTQPSPISSTNEDSGERLPPRIELRAERGQANRHRAGLVQNRGTDWWAIGAGVGAVAVGVITAFALSSRNNNRQ